MKKKWIEKVVILIALASVLVLFAFFLKDVLVPLFSMELNNDIDGASALLKSKGAAGGAAVSLIEALQMVVIFIPAEFIQVSAGLSYPFYIALLLCDLGVCLGASIIFVLVRIFRFDTAKSRKSEEQIKRIGGKNGARNTQMLMYLLFITPIIPFGAICYFASAKRINYRRYIFTVATGVIPSIVTSNLIGAGVRAFIMKALPMWVLALIIVLMMALLFVLLWLFLDKIYFRGHDGTPDSAAYFLVIRLASLWRKHCQKLNVDDEKLRGLDAPFIVLCNHVSFYDFYYVVELLKDYNPAYVINHHICTAPVLRYFSKKAGMIPKKMFTVDKAAVKMLRTLRAGYPIVVFPEGRLSIDGCGSPIIENATAVYKRFGYPLVLTHISGAYYSYPKWRKKFYRSEIDISVKRVITPQELKQTSVEELDKIISEAFCYNETEQLKNLYHQKNKAKGLETMLYRCADCTELYSTRSKAGMLYCTSCGKAHHLDERYRFTDDAESIPAYYERIKDIERSRLDSIELKADVHVKIFSDKKPHTRKEKGFCTLNRKAFTYRSDRIEFCIPTEKLQALAFSCGKEFELYHQNEQYYFYPVENPAQVVRWSLIVDLLREERVGHGKEKGAD